MRRGGWTLSAVGMLLMPQWALAGSVLDFIRNYDLNNYSLGIGLSGTQNPFVGAKNSAYAYPYLTSFRHSAFTDDWILIRDGELGLRWVSDNGWELGVIGRVQTRGFGNLETDDLLGIADRKWALEMGPTIGWRGWPVHINWTTYFEPTNRHDGLTSQLAFLVPLEWARGYLVPSVELVYQSDEYNDYYYSVTEPEAAPIRPAYQPDASIGTALKIRWGIALSDNWLLTGKFSLEELRSEITDSPIIDRDRVWSAGLAVAYNANVFQPRQYTGPLPQAPQFDLRISGFRDSIDTKVVRDTADGVPGFEADIEDFLGASDKETLLQIDASVRIGHYHRLEFGYFELGRNASTILDNDLNFGDELFPAGTEVKTNVDLKLFRVGYAYSLIRNAQLEVSVMAGIHLISLETDIAADSSGRRARSRAGTPLPVIGLQASLAVAAKTTLAARLQFFRTDFDRYEGSLNYAAIDLEHRISKNFSVGLGYSFYGMKLSSDESDVNGRLEVSHRGPSVFFTMGY